MLTDAKNAELYNKWFTAISEPQVRSAFQYLVGVAARLDQYQCHIQWKGEARDFRFHDAGGEQPYSFISNARWLLFYFRRPAVRSARFSGRDLASLFDSCAENPAGEWTIRLKSIPDVERLIQFLRW